MARIQSPVWNIIRGSIAGTTYLANQYHQIVARARTAPVQPATIYRTAIKSAMSAAASQWLALSEANRLAWDSYADTVVYSGPLGDYTLTGRLSFIATQVMMRYCNYFVPGIVTPGATAPIIAGWLTMGLIAINEVANPETGVAISVTNESGEDAVAMAQISGGYNASRMQYKGPWKAWKNQAVDCLDMTSTIIPFIDLAVGKAYFMKIRLITEAAPHRITKDFFLRMVATSPGP